MQQPASSRRFALGLAFAAAAVAALAMWRLATPRQAGRAIAAPTRVAEEAPAAAAARERSEIAASEERRAEAPAAEPEPRPLEVEPVPEPERAWLPELVLHVRDATNGAELDGLELRLLPNAFASARSALPGEGSPVTALGAGLRSPIALRGGRPATEGEGEVHGVAMRPVGGAAVEYAQLGLRADPARGVTVWARTAELGWGSIQLDLSAGGERELLLEPGAELELQLANLALEAYAALELDAGLYLTRPDRPQGEREAWKERLDGSAAEGLRFEGLPPGEYAASVELGELGSWRPRVVLARAELALAPGERRTLLLTLDDPPQPRARPPLAGTLAFPAFPGEEEVMLRLYDASTYSQGPADLELPLSEMRRVGGALPTWSWQVAELPEGTWQAKVWPFLKSWIFEQPPEGRADLELALPELAELAVETVDAASGARVPLERLGYGYAERLPGQVNHLGERAAPDGEPGLFRLYTAPGTLRLSTSGMPSELGYGDRFEELDVAAGLQEHRFVLERPCAIRFELREGGALLPREDPLYMQLFTRVRGVGHDGHVTIVKLATERLLELSGPGLYEIDFEGLGAGRYLPVPPRQVEVRPGEVSEVVVELRRE